MEHETRNMKHETRMKILILIIVIAVLSAIYLFYSTKSQSTVGKYDEFAKCLASKNITMYGAAWCSHCQNEKKAFGDSFKYVPYIGCPDEPQKCLSEGVTGYPTWVFRMAKNWWGSKGLKNYRKKATVHCRLNSSVRISYLEIAYAHTTIDSKNR